MPLTKIFVGNLPDTLTPKELESEFEKYGEVAECDIIRDYAFVHLVNENEARAAVKGLDGYRIKGSKIRVEMSKSSVRQKPGMGDSNNCFRCGDPGHWSRDCLKNDDAKIEERLKGRREREAARAASRGSPPPRDPYYDPYYRDYHRDRYPPRYSPYDLPPRRAPPPPPPPEVKEYDDDPYLRPPYEYYLAKAPSYRRDPYYSSPYASRAHPPTPRVPDPEFSSGR